MQCYCFRASQSVAWNYRTVAWLNLHAFSHLVPVPKDGTILSQVEVTLEVPSNTYDSMNGLRRV